MLLQLVGRCTPPHPEAKGGSPSAVAPAMDSKNRVCSSLDHSWEMTGNIHCHFLHCLHDNEMVHALSVSALYQIATPFSYPPQPP